MPLSACADAISQEPPVQARLLVAHGLSHIDLRRVWGRPLAALSSGEIATLHVVLREAGLRPHILYSDLGYDDVTAPPAAELARLERLLAVARALEAPFIRLSTGRPPGGDKPANHLLPAIRRLKALLPAAEAAGVTLLLENAPGTVGEIPSNIHSLLHALNSPFVRLAWNPGAFVRAGVAQQVPDFWLLLGRLTGAVLLEDATLLDRAACLPGEGDADLPELLVNLREARYGGVLALDSAALPAGLEGRAQLALLVLAARRLLAAAGRRG